MKTWVATHDELPERIQYFPALSRPVEFLNDTPILCVGLNFRDRSGGMCIGIVVLNPSRWDDMPESFMVKPGSEQDGCWVENPGGWTNLQLHIIPCSIGGLSMSYTIPTVKLRPKAA